MITHITLTPYSDFITAWSELRKLRRYLRYAGASEFKQSILSYFNSLIDADRLSPTVSACALASMMHHDNTFRYDMLLLRSELRNASSGVNSQPRFTAFVERAVSLFVGYDLQKPACVNCGSGAPELERRRWLDKMELFWDDLESFDFLAINYAFHCSGCDSDFDLIDMLSGCSIETSFAPESI